MKELNSKSIIDVIKILEEKPYMLLNKFEGYNTYESYINGFLRGIDISTGLSISKDFGYWLGSYYGVENSNVHWASFLRTEFRENSEEKMTSSLFELLKQFVNQLNESYNNS